MMEFKEISKYADLFDIWTALSVAYTPPLYEKIPNFEAYVMKINEYGHSIACYIDGSIGGCISFYSNDLIGYNAYITQIATHPNYQGKGIASALLGKALSFSKRAGMTNIRLEVKKTNIHAQCFYRNHNFRFESENQDSFYMIRELKKIGEK